MSNVVVVGEELLDLPFLQLDQVEDSLTPTSSPSAPTGCA